jgi:hypothetical protein
VQGRGGVDAGLFTGWEDELDRENDGVFERAGVLDTESRDGVVCLLEGLDETEDFLFTFSLLSNEYSSSL